MAVNRPFEDCSIRLEKYEPFPPGNDRDKVFLVRINRTHDYLIVPSLSIML